MLVLANTYPPIRLHCDRCKRQVDELFSRIGKSGKRFWICKRCVRDLEIKEQKMMLEGDAD